MIKKMSMIILAGILGISTVSAQDDSSPDQNGVSESSITQSNETLSELKGKVNGLEESYLETKSTVDKLKKIKVSGYIQTQFRYAPDTSGWLDPSRSKVNYEIGEFQGGKLLPGTQSVFQLRRARVKVAYESELSMGVLQLDCLPFTTGAALADSSKGFKNAKPFLNGGGVTVKDAYLRFTDPWLKSISVKAGIFDRPFGFEIAYSSSTRESPERSRVFQTLFPGERDLGFSLEYAGADHLPLPLQYVNFKGGWFAGNGINIEFDNMRDFIGRLGFTLPFNDINMSVDCGVSGYAGYVLNQSDSLYEVKDKVWVGEKGQKWSHEARRYMGGDVELYYGNLPILGGISLRGEVISGVQPSLKSSNGSQKSDQALKDAIYSREVVGYYGMAVLNIDPIRCQLVGKYDYFDPNKGIAELDVKNTADIAYTTVGGGLVYHWDENVKFMAYYDRVTNEETSVAPFVKDVNDNVFTFRIQYKF